MGTEFFDELGETITKTAKGLGERAELLYETQKLRGRISGEERMVHKTMEELGNILYKRYLKGEALDDEQRSLCEQIAMHKERILKYKDSLADMKGKKICPSCQRALDRDAAFCSYCGASCARPEEADDTVAEAPEEAFEEAVPQEAEEGTAAEDDTPVGEFKTEAPQADAAEEASEAQATTEEIPE
ncbi:MAG: zinc ribbon domain-containing protein [Eubacteriales bacterium]|nr:zinc ribbon domain-containing protein [Eubacteriales bacterium]